MAMNIISSCVEIIKGMFKVTHFSLAGSSEREREEATYMLFLDLLYDSEDSQGASTYFVSQSPLLIIIWLLLHDVINITCVQQQWP